MLKFNRTKTITLAFAGSVLSLAALLIFTLLPTSELANGIQYSGRDALWVLILAPVLAFLGAISFMYAFLKDYKVWLDFLSRRIAIPVAVIFAVLLIFNFAVYLSYLISQFSLGFVAPYTGTAYETLAIIAAAITILQFIVSALAVAAAIRNK